MISVETLLLRLNIEGALAHMRESAPAEGARKCGCAPTATHAAAPRARAAPLKLPSCCAGESATSLCAAAPISLLFGRFFHKFVEVRFPCGIVILLTVSISGHSTTMEIRGGSLCPLA